MNEVSQDEMRLAELLCARLCHDLSGPVGATAAGAELLGDGGADAETVGLVAASATWASARLRFFRAAFGPSAADMPMAQARDLAQAYLESAGSAVAVYSLAWHGAEGRLDGALARLALNLVLLARDALPRGGEVAVRLAAPGDPLALTVAARGTAVALPDEAAALLARALAATAGLNLSATVLAHGIDFTAAR